MHYIIGGCYTINAISDVAVGEVFQGEDDHDRIAPLLFRNAFHTCYINLLRRVLINLCKIG